MHALFRKLKQTFYFTAAGYFGFFAKRVLKRWKPTIVVITGSSGKTTLLHLIESQLKEDAVYSHQANSAFGVPFNILGLKRGSYALWEWPLLFINAPLQSFRKIPEQKYYVVEADAERPGEAQSIAELLKPDVVIWLSLGQAHGASYDKLVSKGAFTSVLSAIAYEYGHTLANAESLVIVNTDNEYILKQMARTTVDHKEITKKSFRFEPNHAETIFTVGRAIYTVPALVPRDTGYAISAIVALMDYLGRPLDKQFTGFVLPPGRSSVLAGVNGVTIIDSTYNATIEGMRVMLDLFKCYPAPGGNKWLVLGDMLEQGVNEAEEHKKLADLVLASGAERVVLVGPRLEKHTYPLLKDSYPAGHCVHFPMPKPALDYLQQEIAKQGGETIMFKGARFLEGIVEHLLADPADAAKLCRREVVWAKRRKQWGL